MILSWKKVGSRFGTSFLRPGDPDQRSWANFCPRAQQVFIFMNRSIILGRIRLKKVSTVSFFQLFLARNYLIIFELSCILFSIFPASD